MNTAFVTKVIYDWGVRCFGRDHMRDPKARALRLVEEAIELCQSVGVKKEDVVLCTGVVYSRPPGEALYELGGVIVCSHAFAAMCGWDFDMVTAFEINRCLSKSPEQFAKRNEEKNKLGLTG